MTNTLKKNAEEWRAVKDYPRYQISNRGNIIYTSTIGNVKRCLSSLSVNTVCQNQYKMVRLVDSVDGVRIKARTVQIGRLVLETFNPVEGMEHLVCDHIDDDKTNNNLENLQWLTYGQNSRKSIERRDFSKIKKHKGIWVLWMDGGLEFYKGIPELGNSLDIKKGKYTRLYKMVKEGLQSKKWKIKGIYEANELPDELQHLVPHEEPLF